MELHKHGYSLSLLVFQAALLICFAVVVDYKEYNHASFVSWPGVPQEENANRTSGAADNAVTHFYPFFQDVHVMIFIGFGFLMTFLKKYSYGAVGYNLFIAALVIQWATLVNGWITNAFNGVPNPGKVRVDIKTLITSDFCAGAVLITFGAVLGKVSRLQLFTVGVFEVIFYAINENILIHYLKITDVGGSLVIHMFGAYFGLALARMLYREEHEHNENEGSVYHSDIFAMIGTVFLWMFWPSFNGAMLGPGNQQHRAVINTYYSLAACCVATFIVSPLVSKGQKLNMVHVQNATLAGGVAVGTCADLIIHPWGAALIGTIAGVISTLGYAHLTPLLTQKLKVHDTCGVHNLHGMPAVLAGISGAVAAGVATMDTYDSELTKIFPALAESTVSVNGTMSNLPGRNAIGQAGMQTAAIFVTLALALTGGFLTGFIVRFLDAPTGEQLFDDRDYWALPSDGERCEEPLLKNAQLTAEENC